DAHSVFPSEDTETWHRGVCALLDQRAGVGGDRGRRGLAVKIQSPQRGRRGRRSLRPLRPLCGDIFPLACTTSPAAWPSSAAVRLHERGASVAVNVRSQSSFDEWALVIRGDITAPGVPEEIVNKTMQHFGRVDILVNNAAHAKSTRFPNLTAEEWRLALEVNMTAPFLLIKAVFPIMKAQKYGRIVNVSSSAGRTVSTL